MSDIINIWLDDERDPLKHSIGNWIWVKTVEECIDLLKQYGMSNINAVSLDHDLGIGYKPGYDVLLWIEEEVAIRKAKPPQDIRIHTANSSARYKMNAAVKKIYQLAVGIF